MTTPLAHPTNEDMNELNPPADPTAVDANSPWQERWDALRAAETAFAKTVSAYTDAMVALARARQKREELAQAMLEAEDALEEATSQEAQTLSALQYESARLAETRIRLNFGF